MTKAKVVVTPVEMPKAVLIGSVIYRVTTDRDDWLRIENATQCKGAYGHTEPMWAVIFISPETSPDNQRMTLWHEVMHALCETAMGSPNWDHLGEGPTEREERVIRSFESPTLLVLRDNPQLVAYLTA
jgi:hypothetical protein